MVHAKLSSSVKGSPSVLVVFGLWKGVPTCKNLEGWGGEKKSYEGKVQGRYIPVAKQDMGCLNMKSWQRSRPQR